MLEKMTDMFQEFATKLVKGEVLDSKEAKESDEKYSDERHSLLGEVVESGMARSLPMRSKFFDLGGSIGILNADSEAVRRQKEFESATAWTMFIPDRLLKIATDPVLTIPGFKSFVEKYPAGGKTKAKLFDEMNSGKDVDPDRVVDFLRLVHQDMITGVVTYKTLSGDTEAHIA